MVDDKNTVSIRAVKVGDRVGSMWIIREGLKPGQRVVAEGVQKVRPGTTVNPKPFSARNRRQGSNACLNSSSTGPSSRWSFRF